MKNPRKDEVKFVVVYDASNQVSSVEHVANGTLIDEIRGENSYEVARAIAVLANFGYLCRNIDGTLAIGQDCDHDSVRTMEEFMEEFDEHNSDDAPEDDDTPAFTFGPPDSIGEG